MGSDRVERSSSRLARLQPHLARLRKLMGAEINASACWQLGDEIARILPLVGGPRPQTWLADHLGISGSRLSELKLVAACFPAEQRSATNFHASLLAYRIFRKLGPELRMSAAEIRDHIETHCRGRRWQQVRACFLAMRQDVLARSRDNADGSHVPWRDVVGRLRPGSVKLVLADPLHGRPGELDDAWLASMLPLFYECRPKLAPGGCIAVFQPGMRPDCIELLLEAARCHFCCIGALTWEKSQSAHAPTNRNAGPFIAVSERILLFQRKGDPLPHRAGQPHADVLHFPHKSAGKPAALLKHLIDAFAGPGDVVLELFGGSGRRRGAGTVEQRRTVDLNATPPDGIDGAAIPALP